MTLMYIVLAIKILYLTNKIKELTMEFVKPKMTKEELRQLLELRRSSAASKHRNKKKYRRKEKHREF